MTKEDKAVLENEEKGRNQFISICKREDVRWCSMHRQAKKRHSKWDVSIFNQSNGKMSIVEIKTRKETHDKYKHEWYLEKDKAEALIEIAKKCENKAKAKNKEIEIAYVNLFNDNLMAMWTFTIEELQAMPTTKRWCQKNEWTDIKELKDVYLLSYTNAKFKEEIDLSKSIFRK
jgi:Holliday junction resolvase